MLIQITVSLLIYRAKHELYYKYRDTDLFEIIKEAVESFIL